MGRSKGTAEREDWAATSEGKLLRHVEITAKRRWRRWPYGNAENAALRKKAGVNHKSAHSVRKRVPLLKMKKGARKSDHKPG